MKLHTEQQECTPRKQVHSLKSKQDAQSLSRAIKTVGADAKGRDWAARVAFFEQNTVPAAFIKSLSVLKAKQLYECHSCSALTYA
jgi:hypothetical protein